MFVHIGKDMMVNNKDIIMILDYQKIKKYPHSKISQESIKNKDIKTVIITQNKILFSPITPGTIEKRIQNLTGKS